MARLRIIVDCHRSQVNPFQLSRPNLLGVGGGIRESPSLKNIRGVWLTSLAPRLSTTWWNIYWILIVSMNVIIFESKIRFGACFLHKIALLCFRLQDRWLSCDRLKELVLMAFSCYIEYYLSLESSTGQIRNCKVESAAGLLLFAKFRITVSETADLSLSI